MSQSSERARRCSAARRYLLVCAGVHFLLLANVHAVPSRSSAPAQHEVASAEPHAVRKPSCTVSDRGEVSSNETAAGRWGNDRMRKALYREVNRALTLARAVTMKDYPPAGGGVSPSAPTSAKARQYEDASRVAALANEAGHLAELLRMHDLSCAQLVEVFREGRARSWQRN